MNRSRGWRRSDLDRLQYRLGEGPCLAAADPAGPAFARSGDLAADPAWPEFGPAAASSGYASVLATALLLPTESDEAVGALNLYSREPGTLDGVACDTALLLATHASLALAAVRTAAAGARVRADAQNQMVNLRKALDTRTVIGQATGILTARRGLDADKAFALLSRTSQNPTSVSAASRRASSPPPRPPTTSDAPSGALDGGGTLPEFRRPQDASTSGDGTCTKTCWRRPQTRTL